ncbi:helix-turn-helix domain-containing protein [Radiobacillus deserti]|uniref:Helicase Helix-turn-helix domain-containing protein n=1 Tax=Radiobacillus deserti TaxID=2594883 RepID=A0A516KGH3_9BACI|nr:helix-turn-helix domain-containing protein [Radiobacillus deserti]QDP40495.1 hypothetical protein FN924_10035 [Radiobacillus deserti]
MSAILLDGISKMNQERSISGLYHILSGKRSAQTLQDAHLFKLTGFFGICKSLPRERFDQKISQLVEHHYISPSNHDTYTSYFLTSKGMQILVDNQLRFLMDKAEGLTYEDITEPFFQRILLGIQTFSNVLNGENTFIPIIDSPAISRWVKRFYIKNKTNVEEVASLLYEELQSILEELPEREATIFVDRLSGYKDYGQTLEQLGDFYQLDVFDIQVILIIITHHMIKKVQEGDFPLLRSFLPEVSDRAFLTQSAQRTKAYLDQGLRIEEIARIRRLKTNTIEDHVVEIIHAVPNMSLGRFIDESDMDTIKETIHDTESRRLRDIKQVLDNRYSYFQIRLAMAVIESQTEEF